MADERDAERAEIRAARRARIQLDRVLSLAAAFVAVCALAVSVYQTKIMREQQRASAWPRLDLPQSTSATTYGRLVQNQGLGPALVRSVEITYDGRHMRDWNAVTAAVFGDSAERVFARDSALAIETNTVARGSVILPGATVSHIRVHSAAVAPLLARLASGRLRTAICYCSLYGECWRVTQDDDADDPMPVDACEADPARQFR